MWATMDRPSILYRQSLWQRVFQQLDHCKQRRLRKRQKFLLSWSLVRQVRDGRLFLVLALRP